MSGLLKNEILKLINNKKLYALLVLILAINLFPILITASVGMRTTNGQGFPLTMYGLLATFIMPVFLMILIAEMITDELSCGTMALSMVHPVTRFQILTAKVIHLFCFIIIIMLFALILSYGLGTVIFGWGAEFMDSGIIYSTSQGLVLTIGSYLGSVLPLLSFSLFVTFIAFLLQGSAAVVGVSFGLYLLSVMSDLLVELPLLPVTAYFNMFPYVLSALSEPQALLRHILINAGFGLLFYLLTLWLFVRRDMVE